MIRPGIAALCYVALLVAVTDDWIAAQTGSREDDEAALLVNDSLLTPLVSSELPPSEDIAHCALAAPAQCLAIPVADIYSPAEPPHRLLMNMRC
jgi:hypothetical protein